MNIVSLFIPIYNERHRVIRDTIARLLSHNAMKIVMSDRVITKSYKNQVEAFPICKMNVYMNKIDLNDVKFFKSIGLSISKRIDDVIVVKIQKEDDIILSARYAECEDEKDLKLEEIIQEPIKIHRVSKQVLNLNYTQSTEGLGLIHLFYMGHYIKTIYVDLTTDMEMR